MEFYRKAPASFDWLTVFTDNSCSALRADVTRADIDAIPEPFYKDLALKLFLNQYDDEFRVQEYRAWPHPDEDAAQNKTSPYSLRDNPTGMYVEQGDELVVFAALAGRNVSLLTQDLSTGGWGAQHTYPLSTGLNKITAQAKGLIYVQYYSPQGAAAPTVKIHFATGKVNGYFDSQKHTAAGDWTRLLNNAVADDFDLVGKYAHLTFPTARFKTKTPDGKALVDEWDKLVKLEHEFMGLYAHDRVFRNRIYCHADYNPTAAWMYATSYHTGYSLGSLDEILTVSAFKTSGIWGPAHEIGHVNQVRPGFRWLGMTEVTNNLYSLHVQTAFGNTSRLQAESKYATAFTKLRDQNKPHNDTVGGGFDVWTQLVPFWQLKLYLCDALEKADFYQDLYYYYMTQPAPGTAADTDGRYQLDFVRQSCRIANLNLTAFFESWGFLTPIDKELNDYGTTRFTITQAQIDALKTEIAAHNYPAPARDFTGITDSTWQTYR
jgi:hypothetical protein